MGRQVPWDEIPDSNIIPDCVAELEINSLEEVQSSTGKLMYKGDVRVVEPAEFQGWPVFEYYVIGSDDDPQAQDPVTWKSSQGSRNLKMMLSKAQVPMDGDMDNVCATAVGAHFIATIGQRTTDQGSIMNSIRSYFQVGEKPTGINPTAGAPAARGAVRRPAPAAAAPARAAAPVARPAVPARAPARVATPVAEEEVEPTPTPAPAKRPVGRPPAAAAPARAAAPAKTAEKSLPCSICSQMIPKPEYADHVEQCEGPAPE